MGVALRCACCWIQAVDLPALYDVEGRDGKLMALLVAEIAAMPRLHLRAAARGPAPGARLPAPVRRTSIGASLDEMAADAGMSRRTFTRLFRAQTGASFAAWRQQVCSQAAIARPDKGNP